MHRLGALLYIKYKIPRLPQREHAYKNQITYRLSNWKISYHVIYCALASAKLYYFQTYTS